MGRTVARRGQSEGRGTPKPSGETHPMGAATDAVGALFVVSTPIGNLKDITLRALEVLGSVDLIAAEDTRRTKVLLAEFGITKPLTSYHDHTAARKARSLIAQMAGGKRVALVSEAGSPGISDPCYRLVRAALESGTPVIPVPGPTALVPALVVSGLPVDRFAFEGFLPARSAARRRRLAGLRSEPRTMIFYEAPHRLVGFLKDLGKELGNRELAVARELTKVHEEVVRGPVEHLVELFHRSEPKGEFVVVCEGAASTGSENPEIAEMADRHLEWLIRKKKVSAREAAREVAHVTRMPRNALYSRAVALSKGGKTRPARS